MMKRKATVETLSKQEGDMRETRASNRKTSYLKASTLPTDQLWGPRKPSNFSKHDFHCL